MNKDVVHIFRFTSTQKTAVGKLPSSFLKLIKSQYLLPSGFPRKKHNFSWNSLHPNFFFWEDDLQRPIQPAVRFLHTKLPTSPFLPKNRIFLPSNPKTPQHLEQIAYHLHLPIIKIPNKSQISAPFSKILVPHFFNCRVSMSCQDVEVREPLGQHYIPTPSVSPEPNFITFSHFECQVFSAPANFL